MFGGISGSYRATSNNCTDLIEKLVGCKSGVSRKIFRDLSGNYLLYSIVAAWVLKRFNNDKNYDSEEQHDRYFVKPAIEHMTVSIRIDFKLEKHFSTNDVIDN